MATTDMGQKEGGCCAPFAGELGPRLTQCGLDRGLLWYQVASSSIQPFGHNRHEPKTGEAVHLLRGRAAATSSNTTSLGPRFTSTKWHLDPSSRLATTDIGRKQGRELCPLCWEGAGSPSNTKSPALRPTSVPSGILIHPTVWPQQKWAENWGGAPPPFLGRGAGSSCSTMWPGPRPTSVPSAVFIYLALWPQ